MDGTILSIDCGTQSLRCMVFDVHGEMLDKEHVAYDPYFSTQPGWAEQHPELFWNSLCRASCALSARRPELFKKISGLGVTTQRDSMVNVDAGGNPLRPVITWLDQRKAERVYSPAGILKLVYRSVGMEEALAKMQTDGKCNWIMQQEPEVWEMTYKFLQVSGFLNFRLTGQFRDSIASQIGHIPFNYRKMRWATRRELPARLFPIDPRKLPEVVPPGTVIGTVTKDASDQTGIPEGIPVIACGSDKGCETIGMGVVDETMASLSFGTTATVQTTTQRYFEPLRFMPPYPAPIPDHYNPEVEIFRGYWMITWFKNEFAYKEVLEAQDKGLTPEEVLNDLLANVPAGSMGLLVQPYWGPGLKYPSAKGAMIGFGDVHGRAHVYRAVIEGLGYALLEGLRKIQKAGKLRVKQLTVSGGAAQSDEICRITSDIFGLPLARGKTFETAGLGAAIVTSVGLGLNSSFQSAIEHMVKYDVVFRPDPVNVAVYRRLYERVYEKMFRALRPLYREIRSITGYPERDKVF